MKQLALPAVLAAVLMILAPTAPRAAEADGATPTMSQAAEAGATAPALPLAQDKGVTAPATPGATEATSATPAAPKAAGADAAAETGTPAPAAPRGTESAAPAPAKTRPAENLALNDAARFLAGMTPSPASPLAALTANRQWQTYAQAMDKTFERLEREQLARIRAWSAQNIQEARPTLLYMFSGPDILYASTVFPKAKTYLLSGLEPVGAVPDLTRLKGGIGPVLGQIRASLNSIVNYSFFRTKEMQAQFHSGEVNGTLPILYVFLVRTGNTLREVEPVRIDLAGAVQPDVGPAPAGATRGVRIAFTSPAGEAKTLYYFSTNLANDGVSSSGFLKFAETLGPADAFIKSASYLLHNNSFSTVRQFLLAHGTAIVQDDSGIPLTYYDRRTWEIYPFGRYAGPIKLFAGFYQPAYAVLFKKSAPLGFGIGYRWRPQESNLILAVKPASTANSTK